MNAMASTMVVANVKMNGESLGSGGSVNGQSTRHYRLTSEYSYTSSGGSSSTKQGTMRTVEDYYVADVLNDVIDVDDGSA
jgi:hypothetical protein